MNGTVTETAVDLRWYAVQTKNRQEDRAAANLETLHLETFLPRIRHTPVDGRRWRGGNGIQPLFPGYLFVKCDLAASGHKVTYTRGVHRLVGTAGLPTPVDESSIEIIRSRLGGDGVAHIEHTFRKGEEIRVTHGPFRDLIGVFQSRLTAADRVAILIRTIAREVRVIVDAGMLEAAPQQT